jgi:GMP synthase (glutamine-hydrolysing)
MKPFLVVQLRPEDAASDDEFRAILAKGGLAEADAHRVRLDRETLPETIDLDGWSGVIVGGGPGCVSDAPEDKSPLEARIEHEATRLVRAVLARDFPFLGCCYGIGVLAHALAAEVSKARWGESVGAVDCVVTEDGRRDPLLDGLPGAFRAFVGHKEAVQALPPGCAHLLSSAPCPFQMIRHGRNVYATQFHPEADPNVFELRVRVYRDYGYFPPETADDLIAMCRAEVVTEPERILRGFVARYG